MDVQKAPQFCSTVINQIEQEVICYASQVRDWKATLTEAYDSIRCVVDEYDNSLLGHGQSSHHMDKRETNDRARIRQLENENAFLKHNSTLLKTENAQLKHQLTLLNGENTTHNRKCHDQVFTNTETVGLQAVIDQLAKECCQLNNRLVNKPLTGFAIQESTQEMQDQTVPTETSSCQYAYQETQFDQHWVTDEEEGINDDFYYMKHPPPQTISGHPRAKLIMEIRRHSKDNLRSVVSGLAEDGNTLHIISDVNYNC